MRCCAAALVVCSLAPARLEAQGAVRVWRDTMVIPTYEVGPAERDPIFYTGANYQGAQLHVYPYALQDRLSDVRTPQRYLALHLENEYLAITVLPELGGRIFAATDRTNGYDFFYRQHVIKPALIGMLGAWISGGVEWDVFHHHRATSFMPVDWALRSNSDGSRTIWVGEQERRQRMRWMAGITLRPGRSYLEVTTRLINRTPLPETMLYWANAAVSVDSQYQVIFPPSVRIAAFHGKVVFTSWPVGSGAYAGGVDERRVDQSWWKSQPAPTSFFAWNLREDFFGGYDHGRDAGVVHVADHHVMIGAKLWEWGPGAAGRLWDSRILTDSDGPYAELMAGAYSDNQPDYSWFDPYGVREFVQYWYPVRGIGGFTNANRDAAVNLVVRGDSAMVGLNTTSSRRGARVVVRARDRVVLDTAITVDPAHPFRRAVRVPAGTAPSDVAAALVAGGDTVIFYRPPRAEPPPALPDPVRPPPPPSQVAAGDELYVIGQRAEQINSPSVDPDAYFAEALRRDSLDVRSNLRVGERFLRRWEFDSAETYLRRARLRLEAGYTNPARMEALYALGLALRGEGRRTEARDAFQRAAWDPALRAPAYHQLAELSLGQHAWARALVEAERALGVDSKSDRANAYKAIALRHLGRPSEPAWVAGAAAEDDPFDFLSMNEMVLARRASHETAAARAALSALARAMRGDVQSYLDLASDYEDAGLWEEAADVLRRAAELPGPSGRPYPMVHYHLAYAVHRMGSDAEAARELARASSLPPDYCFPFRFESLDVLRWALERDRSDVRVWYYLGNLLYERQPERAIEAWQHAAQLDPRFAPALRNLGWAYRWTRHDAAGAIASYEAARAADTSDGLTAVELDQLYELSNTPLETRLASLERSRSALEGRSDGRARQVVVLTGLGRYDQALDLLERYEFHNTELAGAIHDAFVDAHLLRGLARLDARDAAGALADFSAAATYPENLEVGPPLNDPRAPQIAFFTALARRAGGDSALARRLLEQAADQRGTEGWPETRYYQAAALKLLGRDSAAADIFTSLLQAGRESVSHRVIGLGFLGLGDVARAHQEFDQALAQRASDLWARYYLSGTQGRR